jgi:acetyl esterase
MWECDTEVITINPAKYGGMYKHMEIYVHKPKNSIDTNRPALIYFHGGAFVFNNAYHTAPIACQHALNFDCTVFGVDYGVAPEVKAPTGGLNAYAAVKYIVENAKSFNIDPSRIAIGGESSGGYITACCSMQLAKKNESHLVKFAWLDIAAVSNHWFERTEVNSTWIE